VQVSRAGPNAVASGKPFVRKRIPKADIAFMKVGQKVGSSECDSSANIDKPRYLFTSITLLIISSSDLVIDNFLERKSILSKL